MPQISVKCVLWDYGNTLLLDPFPKILEKIASDCVILLKKAGYQAGENEFKEKWKEANQSINYPHCTHFAQEEPIIAGALKKLKVLPQDMMMLAPQILCRYRSEMKAHIMNEERNSEVKETVEWIKNQGFMQGVFSNGRLWDPHPSILWMGISRSFDIVESSEDAGIEKPDPNIFNHFLKTLGLEAKDCAYIGDDPVRDVECAKKKGMFAILYKRPAEESAPWRDYKIKLKIAPDAEISSLAELKKMLMLKH